MESEIEERRVRPQRAEGKSSKEELKHLTSRRVVNVTVFVTILITWAAFIYGTVMGVYDGVVLAWMIGATFFISILGTALIKGWVP
jgi:uncharacterized membrane protein